LLITVSSRSMRRRRDAAGSFLANSLLSMVIVVLLQMSEISSMSPGSTDATPLADATPLTPALGECTERATAKLAGMQRLRMPIFYPGPIFTATLNIGVSLNIALFSYTYTAYQL
jgi:hypothetical protein